MEFLCDYNQSVFIESLPSAGQCELKIMPFGLLAFFFVKFDEINTKYKIPFQFRVV